MTEEHVHSAARNESETITAGTNDHGVIWQEWTTSMCSCGHGFNRRKTDEWVS